MVGFQDVALSLVAMIAAPTEAPRTAPAPTAAQSMSAKDDRTRYCVVDTITGSRIARRICHTRNQWLNQGSDPLAGK
ncbi:hypothetical protein [Sphingomonas sp.]|uniref:hypothetical protein n=1 Tax=Sphingomonas sp. TaxID=28214 RepID=UPI002EDB9084